MAANNVNEAVKQTLEAYFNSGEQVGRLLLELHEQSTTWANQTILARLFEAQRTAGRQLLDSTLAISKSLYRIGDHSGSKA